MIKSARRLTAFLAVALTLSVSAQAATLGSGVTGAYLSGQQAMVDLSTSKAADSLEKAARADWDNPLVVERAFVALAADARIDEAAEIAAHLLELDPQNEMAKLVVATKALHESRFGDAVTALEGIGLETYPGLAASVLRGWALVGDGKYEEADKALQEAGDEGIADFLIFHRAVMAEVAGKLDEAVTLSRAAYEADPGVARLVEAYARILAEDGKLDDAKAVLSEYAAKGLEHPLVDVVREAIDAGKKPGAFAVDAQAGAAEMYHSIGVALSREVRADFSIVFLRLGMYLDPELPLIPMALAEVFDLHDQHETANALYESVQSASPLKSLAVVRVAQNLDALGQRDEALRQLKSIVAAHPEDLDAVSVLGDLLRDDEKFPEAAEAYSQALAITGGDQQADWRFYYVRGIAYERSKEWPKAEADFLKALELNPDQPQVLNYLGYSWVDQNMHLDRALGMIEKAVSAAPNDGYIIDSLGWAFYRLGRFDEAVRTLEQAVQLLPQRP